MQLAKYEQKLAQIWCNGRRVGPKMRNLVACPRARYTPAESTEFLAGRAGEGGPKPRTALRFGAPDF